MTNLSPSPYNSEWTSLVLPVSIPPQGTAAPGESPVQEMLDNLLARSSDLVGGYLPNLVGALLILVIGWLAALVLAAIVRGALKRTTLDNRLVAAIGGESARDVQVERIAGKAVYYLAMLFVLVAFFQALNLTIITEPLNALLTRVTEFVPRVLGAGALLALAWVLATVLRTLVSKAMTATDLDRRLGGEAGFEDGEALPLSQTLGEAVYWLVFLLFLPAILGALALEGLLEPVQGLTDQVLTFLPNIFAAGLILAIGWFVARLVQRIVANLLAAAGFDSLAERVGLDSALGDRKLSGLLGLIVYVLVLIPVLISSLNALELDAITRPASNMLGQILDAVPGLFAAGLLLTIAYFIGKLVSGLISNLLAGAGFNSVLAHLGFGTGDPEGGGANDENTPSDVVGILIMVAIMLFASIEAAGLLGFVALSGLLSGFIVFAGQVVLGLIVLGVGLYLSNVAARAVLASGAPQSGLLATAARISIIVLAGAMALRQMGLADDIINLAFGLLLGSIAVAVALAFGLGARETAARYVDEWTRNFRSKDPGA